MNLLNKNGTRGRDILGMNLFNCHSADGYFNGVLRAQGNQNRANFAKQFSADGDLKAIGEWYAVIGAAVVAQTEREFIRQRQAEGIAATKAQGVQFGRRPMVRPASFAFLKEQWKQQQISARAATKQLGITHSTFLRWVNEDNG